MLGYRRFEISIAILLLIICVPLIIVYFGDSTSTPPAQCPAPTKCPPQAQCPLPDPSKISPAVCDACTRNLEVDRKANSVWQHPFEQKLIELFLNKDVNMLEYGSGFSTLWYPRFVKHYYSIEHDLAWYTQTKQKILDTNHVTYQLSQVDANHKGWKGGLAEGNYDQFEEYIKSVADFGVAKFDRVLIDGRARAHVAKYLITHNYLHADSIVFIHDYFNRPYYFDVVKEYYDVLSEMRTGQSLVVLKPKKEFVTK
jgi:hypothetical protein